MKKIVLLVLVATLFMAACSKDKQEENQNKTKANDQPTFTEEDINLAKNIIEYTQQQEKEFVQKANEKLDKTRKEYRERYVGSEASKIDSKIAKDMQEMARKMIIDPLVEKYGDHIVKDGKLKTDINVDMFKWDGNETRKVISENHIFPAYEDVTFSEQTIEYHEKYDLHELVFDINEEETKVFDQDVISFKYSFYKTKEDKLIIGDLAPLKSNVYVSDFTDDKKYIKDDLEKLPPLQ